jgi:hypothetical protein
MSACPKFVTAHFPYWSKKEGHSVISYSGSKSDFLEGRDYFYLHEDIIEYVLQFGNVYDPVGISPKFLDNSCKRRAKEPENTKSVTNSVPDKIRKSERFGKADSALESILRSWREEKESEGFVFDVERNIFMGKRVRRFADCRSIDGTVVCYRTESFTQSPFFGIVRDDQVPEVLSLKEVYRGHDDFLRKARRPKFNNAKIDDDTMEMQSKIVDFGEDSRIESTALASSDIVTNLLADDQAKLLDFITTKSKKLEKLYSDLIYQVRQIQINLRASDGNASAPYVEMNTGHVDTLLSSLIQEHKNDVFSLKTSLFGNATNDVSEPLVSSSSDVSYGDDPFSGIAYCDTVSDNLHDQQSSSMIYEL